MSDYVSLTQASRELSISLSNISRYCHDFAEYLHPKESGRKKLIPRDSLEIISQIYRWYNDGDTKEQVGEKCMARYPMSVNREDIPLPATIIAPSVGSHDIIMKGIEDIVHLLQEISDQKTKIELMEERLSELEANKKRARKWWKFWK